MNIKFYIIRFFLKKNKWLRTCFHDPEESCETSYTCTLASHFIVIGVVHLSFSLGLSLTNKQKIPGVVTQFFPILAPTPPPTPENWLYSSTPHPGMELLNIYSRLSFIGGYLPYEIHVYLWRANRDLNLKVLYIPRLNKPAYICTRVCRLII